MEEKKEIDHHRSRQSVELSQGQVKKIQAYIFTWGNHQKGYLKGFPVR